MKLKKYKVILWLAMSLVCGAVQAESATKTYEERFLKPRKGVRTIDNNVWVYKSSFARRFGMPAQWVDDSLKGAEAVAYRVEWYSMQICGYFGESDNCRPNHRCIIDIYMSDKESAKLPWKSEEAQGFMHQHNSMGFLAPQDKQDTFTWDPEKQRSDMSYPQVGLDSMSWVSGPPRDKKVFSGSSSGVHLVSYDRAKLKGLDYLELSVDCGIATQKEQVRIFFEDEFPDRNDYGVTYNELVEKRTQRARNYLRIKKEWFEKFKTGTVNHVIAFPDSYMVRVNKYDREVYEPNSLATEAIRRIKDTK